jgi:hypothetical protein
MIEQEAHIGSDQARAGSTRHVVCYILVISLILAMIMMAGTH